LCHAAPLNPALHYFPTRRSSDLRSRLAFEPEGGAGHFLFYLHAGAAASNEASRQASISAHGLSKHVPSFSFVASLNALRIGQVSDRKSTRLNSSHSQISYAVFCL